jgi:hypothetical protein
MKQDEDILNKVVGDFLRYATFECNPVEEALCAEIKKDIMQELEDCNRSRIVSEGKKRENESFIECVNAEIDKNTALDGIKKLFFRCKTFGNKILMQPFNIAPSTDQLTIRLAEAIAKWRLYGASAFRERVQRVNAINKDRINKINEIEAKIKILRAKIEEFEKNAKELIKKAFPDDESSAIDIRNVKYTGPVGGLLAMLNNVAEITLTVSELESERNEIEARLQKTDGEFSGKHSGFENDFSKREQALLNSYLTMEPDDYRHAIIVLRPAYKAEIERRKELIIAELKETRKPHESGGHGPPPNPDSSQILQN